MKLDPSYRGEIIKDILFTLLTCGIYGLFWQNRLFKAVNALSGQERFSFWPWLLLTMITCGLYNLYAQYQYGQTLIDAQRAAGVKVNDTLAWLSLILNIFGLGIVMMAIDQHEINLLGD
jgi:hypothetical protein